MKKLIYLFCLLVSLVSCEKSDMNLSFNRKILNGYFVTSIAFDKLGNTWIGTFKQGLIKYNSKETVVFNSSNSIISDTSVIHDLAVDSRNNLWIGCEGIIKYDGTTFTKFNSKNTLIPEDLVRSIAIDSKDNVWFTSCRFRQGGIVKYDGANWTVYTPNNSNLPGNLVGSIAIDRNDNVWLALSEVVNDSYLIKIADDQWSIYTSKELGFTPYYLGNIQFNSKNQLCGAIDYSLSSTAIHQGPKVFIFDGNKTNQIQNDSISNIRKITIDSEDNIWCIGDNGYAVFDGKKWMKDDSTFKEVSVFAIEESKDNKIWIGTGNGVYIND